MTLVMLNRMRDPIAEVVLPESQCGFRRNRGTTDMIFAVRQLMEKAREQYRNLYITLVDFTRAFDSVSGNALWVMMNKWDVPQTCRYPEVLASRHDSENSGRQRAHQ